MKIISVLDFNANEINRRRPWNPMHYYLKRSGEYRTKGFVLVSDNGSRYFKTKKEANKFV